jgi:hypothetical protein
VPVAWFGPELWGSGELLRSAERARIPNPGQPALAAVPALEVPWRFLLMAPPLVSVGLLLAIRRPVALAAVAWVAIVASLSQAGFAGEERYLLPAAAAACVAAGVGWSGRLRRRGLVVLALLALAPLPLVAAEARDLRRDLADDAELRAGLEQAIAEGGGAGRLRCGALAAGRFRFPLVAWHFGVPISAVDLALRGRDGTVLSSRLRRGAPLEPVPAAGRLVGRGGPWEIRSTCAP